MASNERLRDGTSRRTFILTAAGIAAAAPLLGARRDPPGSAGSAGSAGAPAVPPSPAAPTRTGPLRIGVVGVGNRGWDNIQELLAEAGAPAPGAAPAPGSPAPGGAAAAAPLATIAALCDVDSTYLARAGAALPDAARFTDWRELLAAAQRGAPALDGVLVATPDHAHFPIAAAALRAGLPVYCEKPLTHTRAQAAQLRALAAAAGVATQMGTQIHAGENYRRVVEAIRGGAIGRVTAVDCWQLKSWGGGRLTPGAVCPPTLDWPRWLCEEPAVPYIDHIHPANWRRYWAYGSGTLGDMGCHILDLPVWALGLWENAGERLARPIQVHAFAAGPAPDAVGCPEWLEASWAIPRTPGLGVGMGMGAPDARSPGAGATKDSPDPLILRWFDGGRKPPFVEEIGAKDRQDYHGRFSVCFLGTQGALFANYDQMQFWPPALGDAWKAGEAARAASKAVDRIPPSPGHHREWLEAIAARAPLAPRCSFNASSRLTELVLSGMDAYRAGGTLDFEIA
ncbi:MAG: Gfo/Idh/MocA family oxidoreductase [Phycisphaerales bacterium]